MTASRDTLEDRAWTLLAQIMGNRGAWGREEVDAVFSALSGAVEAERQRCMADVCEGCREGWAIETHRHATRGNEVFHPVAGEERTFIPCSAYRIRARMEKDNG